VIFNSTDFVAFFLVVYLAYIGLPKRGQNVLLLFASYFFYGWWDVRFLSLLAVSTLVDFTIARRLAHVAAPRSRRLLLGLSVVVNLGILGFFKYFGFFAESLSALLAPIGLDPGRPVLDIVLPVGISFYTFQTLSYTIDVYRRNLEPTTRLLEFAVFVSFFPQLVAGPIERASHLLPQIGRERVIDYRMIREGAWLVLLGYFKKVVVADNLARISSQVFTDPESAHGVFILTGVLAFAGQIYADFSGYSDIARGISRLMGFDLMQNFRAPYFAVNPPDLWRRWHISLSTWLRDYLFVSLGGGAGGTARMLRNVMITMLLGGLWHGAAWHFVAWGLYHGVILCGHRALAPVSARLRAAVPAPAVLRQAAAIAVTFTLTCGSYVLFAVSDLGDVVVLARNLVSDFSFERRVELLTVLALCAPVALLDLAQEHAGDEFAVKRWPRPFRFATYVLLVSLILLWGVPGGQEFIYFQF